MSPVRVTVDNRLLQEIRGFLAEEGVELTPRQMKSIVNYMAQLADVLARHEITIALKETLDLSLNLESGMMWATTYSGEDS